MRERERIKERKEESEGERRVGWEEMAEGRRQGEGERGKEMGKGRRGEKGRVEAREQKVKEK